MVPERPCTEAHGGTVGAFEVGIGKAHQFNVFESGENVQMPLRNASDADEGETRLFMAVSFA